MTAEARRKQNAAAAARHRAKLKEAGATRDLHMVLSKEAYGALKAQPGGATAAVEALGMRLHGQISAPLEALTSALDRIGRTSESAAQSVKEFGFAWAKAATPDPSAAQPDPAQP